MLKKTARRLTIINATVFIFILSVYSATVYALFVSSMDAENKEDLQLLMAALESSIKAPGNNHDQDNAAMKIPDVVKSDARSGGYSPEQAIQWFSPEGQLLAERGSLKIALPFNKAATFEEQRDVHALVLTRVITRMDRKLGYLRAGLPLSEYDESRTTLILDLLIGTLVAAVLSGIAILWVVRQGLKPVELSMQKLADFSADASHELQSPVMVIKTNGTVALKYSEGMRESDREKILAMVDAANQMSATIDALLRLADLEQTVPPSELKRLLVKDLLAEICRELKELAASKDLAIDIAIADPDLSFTAVEIDAKTALSNVLRNALQYSHDGYGVKVRVTKVGKFIEFQIEDFGIGISAKDLPRIFDRFWRSDRARSYRSGGKGLGLSISKNIVDRYQGTIDARSTPGAGTCFIIRFPLSPQSRNNQI
jgi:two-component system, OmpR family, manganese sensing sensor histidine kinase